MQHLMLHKQNHYAIESGSVALTTIMHISGEQECQSFTLDGFILPAHKIALQKTSDFFLPFDLCD
jgi:hypothetical protein